MALFQYHLTSCCTEFQLVQAAADSDTLGLPEMTFICTMTGQHLSVYATDIYIIMVVARRVLIIILPLLSLLALSSVQVSC